MKRKGFTLIETLVAITVLLLSVAAPLSIAAKALFSAYYARDQITAYYLAEEAIEYIKNARDTKYLHDVFGSTGNIDWLQGLENCINNANGCYVDAAYSPSLQLAIQACPSDTGCPHIQFCSASNIWGYGSINGSGCNGWVNSKFTRKIKVIKQNNRVVGDEALIKVTIEWPGQGLSAGKQTFTLTGAMMNWERY